MATRLTTRLRPAACSIRSYRLRSFSSTALRLEEKIPKPPPPIEDSTSALTYKYTHSRPAPLPATDIPRLRSAEEAVTNILYNTPPPSLQPFKKHVLNCLVQNEPGVLSRVSGILAARGFNIDSLVVCSTEIRDLSRMCIVLNGQDGVVEQARRQLEDLVPVWAVLDYTNTRCISRELLLVKVSILGPDYLEAQLVGGPTHDPRQGQAFAQPAPDPDAALEDRSLTFEQEVALAENFEHSTSAGASSPPPLTAAEALRLKHQHLHSINVLAEQFSARIVDVSENSVIVEMSGKTARVEAFLALLKPFGIIESARTGTMVMPRTPIASQVRDESDEASAVDASLLPPG
ncbi:acetolactate synthase [Fomitiporia mediterranea MF3/22]|uniref:acetolactate synthase n=1 Tax=Fomitiporia mediterranea (strain MF3/22) TaxID=694068 RepID=UPI0004409956|nr:acetolactate synthase [Fomitiporia mediterranea MF3/22]EJD03170.1 acetolactate synthase [Fomitiporia mediterranea MF3/22]